MFVRSANEASDSAFDLAPASAIASAVASVSISESSSSPVAISTSLALSARKSTYFSIPLRVASTTFVSRKSESLKSRSQSRMSETPGMLLMLGMNLARISEFNFEIAESSNLASIFMIASLRSSMLSMRLISGMSELIVPLIVSSTFTVAVPTPVNVVYFLTKPGTPPTS